jgi:hypothetical protein
LIASWLESTPFISSITRWKFRTADGETSKLGCVGGKVLYIPWAKLWRGIAAKICE